MQNEWTWLLLDESRKNAVEMTCHWWKWVAILSSIFLSVWMSYLTSVVLNQKFHLNDSRRIIQPSSVWCHKGPSDELMCRFRNICYDPYYQEFQFYVADTSVMSGVQVPDIWMNIDMSTVLGHSSFKMKVSILSFEQNDSKRFKFIDDPTFIIHRFKPDNIMHIVHDDLLPLHFTIESIFDKTAILEKKISLAFADNNIKSPMDMWYRHYSGAEMVMLAMSNETICFKNAYVGLLRATLWFNYGFGQPQGPYLNENFSVQGLENFVEFLKLKADLVKPSHGLSNSECLKVVLLVRSQTRKIININIVIEAVRKAHTKLYPSCELNVVEVDMALHNMTFILSQLMQAQLFIGMHGAGMILSLFLPPFSGIVELFPFGINPENVSFLNALVKQQPSYHFHYEYWQNKKRENSVPGPQLDPLTGKISHLPHSHQNYIKGMLEVPAVHCCHDPAYFYYMYHDTYVDDTVYDPIWRTLSKTLGNPIRNKNFLDRYVFPSSPAYLMCEVSNDTVLIQWGTFSNIKENNGLWLHITVQSGDEVLVQKVTDIASNKLIMNIKVSASPMKLWFQPFNSKNVGGHIKYASCVTKT